MHSTAVASEARDALIPRYREVRRTTADLAEPLTPEDCVVQSMPDVSPPKWHLAHTTWFFETFVLERFARGYRPFHPRFGYLFNSYYQTVGAMQPRAERGVLSRPTLEEVVRYRRQVDLVVTELLATADDDAFERLSFLVTLGLHHEQQHQELLLMDVKYNFGRNPLRPAYREDLPILPATAARATAQAATAQAATTMTAFAGGVHAQGHGGSSPDGADFCFDNETPRHEVVLRPYRLADRPVTCGEWRAFIEDGGYRNADAWLSDGWATAQREAWETPLYWERDGDAWRIMTLGGMRPLHDDEPVCHVSFYEADAYARWAGKRLPTETEWEVAARGVPVRGNFLEEDRLHPAAWAPAPADGDGAGLRQLFGDVWEWTASPYGPYPGFRPLDGSLGEYNGKFMVNQAVLRGGCCVTPRSHARATYRNFYYPHQRWPFAGLRLAEDA